MKFRPPDLRMRLLPPALVLLAACEAAEGPDAAERGSVPLGWEVTEVVRIGSVDGPPEYTLNRVRGLVADDRDRVFVLDQGDQVVRRYDPEGRHELTFGGAGEGPGEFSVPLALAVAGDSVVAYDQVLQRLTYFGPDGEVLRTVPVGINPVGEGIAQALHRTARGWVFVMATGCRFPRPEDPRPRWRLLLVEDEGEPDVIADEVARDQMAVYGEPGCTSLPALAGPSYSVAFDGEGRMYRGDGERYEIRVTELGGEGEPAQGSVVVRVVGREARPLELSPGRVEGYERESLESGGLPSNPHLADRVREVWDSVGYPAHWPYFDELHLDRRGFLWVGRPAVEPGAPRDWDVFSPEGEYLGTLELPGDLDVMAITDRRVWGRVRDDLDVEYVVGLEVGGRPE